MPARDGACCVPRELSLVDAARPRLVGDELAAFGGILLGEQREGRPISI